MVFANSPDLSADLAKIWLAGQDLSGKKPSEVKQMYFAALQEIDKTNVERWY